MPKQIGVVLKVPKGTPAPAGYKLTRSLRTMNVYTKVEAAPVPQKNIDDLINAFGKMGVTGVQAVATNDLEAALSRMTISGGKRKSRKASRKNRKTRKQRR